MAHLKSIEINQFRGIQELSIFGFSDINLIVGDNNSGKTTFLEAIQLLFAKPQLSSIKSITNQRTVIHANNSFYTSFIKMFNVEQDKKQLDLDISAECNDGMRRVELIGAEKAVAGEDAIQLSKMSNRQKEQYKGSSGFIPETAKLFEGKMVTQCGKKTTEKKISCTSLDNGIPGRVLYIIFRTSTL